MPRFKLYSADSVIIYIYTHHLPPRVLKQFMSKFRNIKKFSIICYSHYSIQCSFHFPYSDSFFSRFKYTLCLIIQFVNFSILEDLAQIKSEKKTCMQFQVALFMLLNTYRFSNLYTIGGFALEYIPHQVQAKQ